MLNKSSVFCQVIGTSALYLRSFLRLEVILTRMSPARADHQPPYIIAVLSRCVEIRTFEPRMLVQCVELQRPKFITSAGFVGEALADVQNDERRFRKALARFPPISLMPLVSRRPNIVYVASNHFVWRLVPVSISSQIQQLLQDKQFELALQLAVSSPSRRISLTTHAASRARRRYLMPEM